MLERVKVIGDSASWREFLDIYDPLLRKWLGAQGVTGSDADDIVQEVMRVVLEQIPKFEHNRRPGAFRCWLRSIMAHRLQAWWRDQKRGGHEVGGSHFIELSKQLEDPDSRLSAEWDAQHDRHVCGQLLTLVNRQFKDKTMAAFRQVVLEGQKAPEVAETLGMTANAVRIAQHRVMTSLRKLGEGLLDLSR
jgi:RNA polymerase sigma-70 factor (ECF subfamily)